MQEMRKWGGGEGGMGGGSKNCLRRAREVFKKLRGSRAHHGDPLWACGEAWGPDSWPYIFGATVSKENYLTKRHTSDLMIRQDDLQNGLHTK